jgi:curved DNA-binding protein
MEYKDYYKILGVDRDADRKEIRSAFRRLARKYHPDVNPNDPEAEERFKEINEAHEVLSDPEKRSKYDQLGQEWSQWQQTGGRSRDFDWGQWTGGGPGVDGQRVHVRYGTPEDLQDMFGGGSAFSDFFSQIFGGAGGVRPEGGPSGGFEYQARPARGQDYEQELEISLREAFQGTTRILQKEGRRLEVKIPPGVRNGTRVRMRQEGGPGAAGGESGDLFLRVRIQPDPQFDREGDDLKVSVPVDLYTAVLGGEVRVPTLEGAVMLSIPAGTQPGRQFRLRGKGMPKIKQLDQQGDLYALVNVHLPASLTDKQRELFKELQSISNKGS